MPRKKEISADDLLAIMKLAMDMSELPHTEISFDLPDSDFDLSALPPPVFSMARKKSVSDAMSLPVCGTHPISIRVPARVIRAFKLRALATGCSYQTLMNRALREAAAGFV